METIGQRIAKNRHNKRWTQDKLASELGITQSILSDIENDKVSPRWETITAISDKLDVPVLALLPNSDSNILYQPSMNDNSVGFINHYGSDQNKQLWEALLQAKEDLIQTQKILIETLRQKQQ
ncbi:MAG: helix-turn-helix transcriptional regulator [Flavobacteriales bacterium]|nr:helix-turn-helix transcriptional regulator [Flavobacteriales bacterium]